MNEMSDYVYAVPLCTSSVHYATSLSEYKKKLVSKYSNRFLFLEVVLIVESTNMLNERHWTWIVERSVQLYWKITKRLEKRILWIKPLFLLLMRRDIRPGVVGGLVTPHFLGLRFLFHSTFDGVLTWKRMCKHSLSRNMHRWFQPLKISFSCCSCCDGQDSATSSCWF